MKIIFKKFTIFLVAFLMVIPLISCKNETINSITISESSITLEVGNNKQLSVTTLPENVLNKVITWSSSDPTIAVVNETGLVTALKKGNAEIKAIVDEKTDKCTIIVLDPIGDLTLAKVEKVSSIMALLNTYVSTDYHLEEWEVMLNLVNQAKLEVNKLDTLEKVNAYSTESLDNALALILTKAYIEAHTVRDSITLTTLLENVIDGDIIFLSEGTYSSNFTINKNITLIGEGDETIINGRMELLADVHVKSMRFNTATSLGEGIISIRNPNQKVVLENISAIQNKAGTGDGWATQTFIIAIADNDTSSSLLPENVELSLLNCHFVMGVSQRAITTGDGEYIRGIKINLQDTLITTPTAESVNTSYARGISPFQTKEAEITLNNTTIEGLYYPLNINGENTKVTVENNSLLTGYCAINGYTINSTYEIKDSTLIGRNYYTKGSNDFATIVMNADKTGNTVNMQRSTLQAIVTNTSSQYLTLFKSINNQLNIDQESTLIGSVKNEVLFKDNITGSNTYRVHPSTTITHEIDQNIQTLVFGVNNVDVIGDEGNNAKWCKLTITEEGIYHFVSSGDIDDAIEVRDSLGIYILAKADDVPGVGKNFDLSMELSDGNYFIRIIDYTKTTKVTTVTISKI